ncbi:helix-turn-helix transcriptional regulator [Pseudomonas capeferrum]|uniref:LuxR C-terminal-related transcriptional regulator n=1 Tax=Pseudomonas capeferrum TaxID=1495066 RepID=UPI0015E36714|nr:LuxR C-terminal-related transcriptional regulator [Pseudomonas capeferrum]MBA1204786.1 helix-turn-helix transcriptional regulator [Pseudomonas capeferrum]
MTQITEALQGDATLILLRAPLGYGKSLLLSQLVEQDGAALGFLRIDHGDNDPSHFLGHLYQLLLKRAAPPEMDKDQAWAAIRSHLDGLIAPFVLCLDDLQLLRSARVVGYLEALLHQPPRFLRMVAASEGQPTLGLSHLRRDNRLRMLGPRELALDGEETQQLLLAHGLTPEPAFVYRLQAGSEGWISGVLFWCSAYRELPIVDHSPDQLQQAVQGSYQHIGAFIEEDVLSRLPHALVRFIERTSVVSAFDLELAALLSDQPHVEAPLRKLLQLDLFIEDRVGERLRYQYHPALRLTALQRLRRRNPEQLLHLHQRAADWLLANAFYAQAVAQYGRAKNTEALLRTVEQHTFDLLREGEINAIVDFLRHTLRDSEADHLNLAMTEASALIVTNDIQRTRSCIGALKRLGGPTAERVMQTIAFLRSHLAWLGGNLRHGVDVVRIALERYPQANAATAILHANSAGCLAALGRLEDARQQNDQALLQLSALGFKGYTHRLHLQAGLIELAQGQTEKARWRFFDGGLAPGTGKAAGNFYDAFLHLGQGLVLMQRNALSAAALSLAKAEKIAMDFPHSAALALIFHHQACLFDALGDSPRAVAKWEQARRLARDFGQWRVYRLAGAWRVRHAVRQGDQAFLLDWLHEWHWCKQRYGEDLQPDELLAYAWVQRHLGQRAVVAQRLRALDELAQEQQHHRLRLDILLLRASVALDQHDQPQAMHLLDEAVALACEYQFGHLLHFEGAALSDLFQQLLAPEARKQYELQRALPDGQQLQQLLPSLLKPSQAAQRLFEPVTRREREVLQRMARGQGNAQIAESLFVSLSTVKTHINNLFRKLEVNDRDEALRKARSVGLLS